MESDRLSEFSRPGPRDDVVRRRMRRQERRDTEPELLLRRELHRRGLRYRVDHPIPIPRRRGDVVFTRLCIAVFVDGCFWHGCPEHGTVPKHNSRWWSEKIGANMTRDRDTDERLEAVGWLPIRVWEHEDCIAAADRVQQAVVRRRCDRL